MKTKPNSTDVSDDELESEAGDKDGDTTNQSDETSKSSAVDLSRINELAGREFKSVNDFEKHYQELKSFVGDQKVKEYRSKAENFDKIVSTYAEDNSLSSEEAIEELTALTANSKIGDNSSSNSNMNSELKEIRELKKQLELKDLVSKHPEAESVLDIVKELANSQGKSAEDMYKSSEQIQSLAKAKYEADSRAKKNSVVETNSRLSVGTAKELSIIGKRLEKARSKNAPITDQLEIQAVKTILGQSE